jgi:hypothetical protein
MCSWIQPTSAYTKSHAPLSSDTSVQPRAIITCGNRTRTRATHSSARETAGPAHARACDAAPCARRGGWGATHGAGSAHGRRRGSTGLAAARSRPRAEVSHASRPRLVRDGVVPRGRHRVAHGTVAAAACEAAQAAFARGRQAAPARRRLPPAVHGSGAARSAGARRAAVPSAERLCAQWARSDAAACGRAARAPPALKGLLCLVRRCTAEKPEKRARGTGGDARPHCDGRHKRRVTLTRVS